MICIWPDFFLGKSRFHGILFCLVLSGLFGFSGLSFADKVPHWRLADRAFHKEDRVWHQGDRDSEAAWRRGDRLFFKNNAQWMQVVDRKFKEKDKSWMRKEQSL